MSDGNDADQLIQPCVRCGRRWAVAGAAQDWCPVCHGVLLAPVRAGAEPVERQFRWTARPPQQTPSTAVDNPPFAQLSTGVPLQRTGHSGPVNPPAEPTHRLAAWLPRILGGAAVALGAVALAEALRYLVLLRSRDVLTPQLWVTASDAFVVVASIAAALGALAAAAALADWLVAARDRRFARFNLLDPRPAWQMWVAVFLPVLNLLLPPVLLMEFAPKARRRIAAWWGVWVLNNVLVAVGLWWRTREGTQAHADSVVLAIITALVALAFVVVTRSLVRAVDATVAERADNTSVVPE